MMSRNSLALVAVTIAMTVVAGAVGDELEPVADQSYWQDEAASNGTVAIAVSDSQQKFDCDGCGKSLCDSQACCCASPWSFSFTQTADYGTNLALPLSLTPANTVLAPITNLGAANLLNFDILNQAGLLDNLGLGGPAADVALVPAFQDDFQFQTSAALQRTWQINDDSSFVAGYGFYMSRHPEAQQVDLMSHTATAQYNRRIADRWIASLDYNYVYYLLQDQSFVTQNTGGLSFLFQPSDIWNFKFRVSYSDANFRPTPFLNSDNYAAQVEAIRFLHGGTTDYLSFGYGYGRSEAAFSGFSYDLNNVFVSGRWLIGQQQRDTLQLIASYGNYGFLAADPFQIGTIRSDDILTLSGNLSHQLTDRWSAFAAYTYYNSDSNVFRQVYSQHLISLGITFKR